MVIATTRPKRPKGQFGKNRSLEFNFTRFGFTARQYFQAIPGRKSESWILWFSLERVWSLPQASLQLHHINFLNPKIWHIVEKPYVCLEQISHGRCFGTSLGKISHKTLRLFHCLSQSSCILWIWGTGQICIDIGPKKQEREVSSLRGLMVSQLADLVIFFTKWWSCLVVRVCYQRGLPLLVSVQACHLTPKVEYSFEYDPAQQGRSTFIEPGASDGQLWHLAAKKDQSSADMEIVASANHRSFWRCWIKKKKIKDTVKIRKCKKVILKIWDKMGDIGGFETKRWLENIPIPRDDIFALIYEANCENVISVKTPSGITKKGNIYNKIMQGDFLGPLLSGNMVDKAIGGNALKTVKINMFKNKVVLLSLAVVNNTLGISVCGVDSQQINSLLNTRTISWIFIFQKCEKSHIKRREKNKDICPTLTIYSWKPKIVGNNGEENVIKGIIIGKEPMKDVDNKKYLGVIVAKDGTNALNIKD